MAYDQLTSDLVSENDRLKKRVSQLETALATLVSEADKYGGKLPDTVERVANKALLGDAQ